MEPTEPLDDNESEGLPPSYEQLADELPACAMCLQDLGTHGGPASLPCGHNGCLLCLLQVQSSQPHPVCPLCRMPFDAQLPLQQNTELRDALGRALQASQMMRYAEFETRTSHDHERAGIEQNNVVRTKCQASNSLIDGLESPPANAERMNDWVAVSYMPGNTEGLPEGGHYPDIYQEEASVDGTGRITQYRGDSGVGVGSTFTGGYGDRFFGRVPVTDINLWDVMSGLIALATGSRRNQGSQDRFSGSHTCTRPREISICDSEGVNSVYDCSRQTRSTSASIYNRPSAPPLGSSVTGQDFARVLMSVLETEPPQWVPDSGSTCCMQCGTPFRPVTCFRHHCRFCGNVVCNACSRGRCLLPLQFRQHDPQRVCDPCHEQLLPVQRVLVEKVSHAAQVALHDVTDMSSFRSWVNNPLSSSLQEEIFKATSTLRSYSQVGRLKPERSIPDKVLTGAVGLAIITVAKFGCMVTYKLGTGLVVARREDGSWSAPSAIATCGMGWGLQVGGELTDFILVLHSKESVKAFCGHGHIALGAGLSVAAGPLGRHAEADLRLGDRGAASCYSYSCSKGAFVGVSLEGSIVATRTDANMRFYGDQSLSVSSILLGPTACPRAAAPLYSALQDLFRKFEGPLNCDSAYF